HHGSMKVAERSRARIDSIRSTGWHRNPWIGAIDHVRVVGLNARAVVPVHRVRCHVRRCGVVSNVSIDHGPAPEVVSLVIVTVPIMVTVAVLVLLAMATVLVHAM